MKKIILTVLAFSFSFAVAQNSGQPEALPPSKTPDSPADVGPKPNDKEKDKKTMFRHLDKKKKDKEAADKNKPKPPPMNEKESPD